jgi:predicted RNase H-like HicB family nuclease
MHGKAIRDAVRTFRQAQVDSLPDPNKDRALATHELCNLLEQCADHFDHLGEFERKIHELCEKRNVAFDPNMTMRELAQAIVDTADVDIDRETDGRWIGEIHEVPGVLAYANSVEQVVANAKALAVRVVNDNDDPHSAK